MSTAPESLTLLDASGAPTRSDEEDKSRGLETFGILYGAFIVVNSLIGGGVLTFPAAIARSGEIWICPLIIIIITMLTFCSFLCIGVVVQGTKPIVDVAYSDLITFRLGLPLGTVVSVALTASTFLNTVAYLTAIHRHITSAVRTFAGPFWNENRYITIIILLVFLVVVILPLSLVRHVGHLKKASIIASTCIMYIIPMALYYYFKEPLKPYNEAFHAPKPSLSNVLSIIPAILFAFAGIPISIHICSRLNPLGVSAIVKMLILGLGLVASFYITVAVTVYSTYGNSLGSDFFTSYPIQEWPVMIGTIIYTLKLSLEYPIYLYMGKVALASTLAQVYESMCKKEMTEKSIMYMRTAITLLWSALSFTAALTVSDLLIAVTWSGTILGILSFILPYFLAFHWLCQNQMEGASPVWYPIAFGATVLLCAAGTFLCGMSFVLNITNQWKK